MSKTQWLPSASMSALKARADMLADIRQFFRERDVLEVETPLLCATTATDPYLSSIEVPLDGASDQTFYLQTSPEFAMKRLLASGSGAIFQICKSFRAGERGRRHNPEFTMLEWYRPGFNELALMDEVESLVRRFIDFDRAERVSYRALFTHYLSIDPYVISDNDLQCLVKKEVGLCDQSLSRDTLLELLLTHLIEPPLGVERPLFIYDYPASQAALAEKHIVDGVELGRRFELYVGGVEIANGYFELTDAEEQKQRFLEDIAQRRAEDLAEIPLDERLIEALTSGMPACSGVALGVDRLLMQKLNATDIDSVISFPLERA